MRKKREIESDQQRSGRLARNAQNERDEASAEYKARDAAVRRSIKQFGA